MNLHYLSATKEEAAQGQNFAIEIYYFNRKILIYKTLLQNPEQLILL